MWIVDVVTWARLSKGGRVGGRSTWPVTPIKVQFDKSWFLPFSHHSDGKSTTGQPLVSLVVLQLCASQ